MSEEIIETPPFDLFRNIHGGIDAKITHIEYGEIPTTLSGELLERAESGEFGEIAPPSESQAKRKSVNFQQSIINENLSYLVSTDYYQGRNEEHLALGIEPVSDINEVLLKRQDSRLVIHAARIEIKIIEEGD